MRRGTYSIVARDPQTGEVGAAVQSHWFAVGPIVPWVRPGVGAVCTQSVAEAAYGPGGAGARGAGLVVLSGGVFRHAEPAAVDGVVARLAADRGGAAGVVEGTSVVVDRRYVLAAAGLLAGEHPDAAAGLLRDLLEE